MRGLFVLNTDAYDLIYGPDERAAIAESVDIYAPQQTAAQIQANPSLLAGADVYFDEAGRSLVRVTRPRMYELVRNPGFGEHELDLVFHAHGLALYTFTFVSCVKG